MSKNGPKAQGGKNRPPAPESKTRSPAGARPDAARPRPSRPARGSHAAAVPDPAAAAVADPPAAPLASDGGEILDVTRAKFDLGVHEKPAIEHIPWGYGQDRVTAMVVNPYTLFAYWELSDEAIRAARQGLGPTGLDAWLNLRVYDVSGRIFDGTNAHHYADYGVSRDDRHWFVQVNRPGSAAVAEIGMKSAEGYFVRIARSGRADFPRVTPAPPGPIEWLAVRALPGEPPAPVGGWVQEPSGGEEPPGPAPAPPPRNPPVPLAAGPPVPDRVELVWREGQEAIRREWTEAGRPFEWIGAAVRTTWEAGPFATPLPPPELVREHFEGPVSVVELDGQTRVTHGPWQVVIRGVGGRAERRVLARWEVHASWVAGEGLSREVASWRGRIVKGEGGASEAQGAFGSELRWAFGSEIRLGGASEVHFLGASELRFGGATELLFQGASEQLAGGASEWVHRGASERWLGGASETRWGGASDETGTGLAPRE